MKFIREYRYAKFLTAAVVFFFVAFEVVRLEWGEIQETYILRFILASLLNISILVTALIGEKLNSHKRNRVIILVLFLYAVADMLALNSSWFRSSWKVILIGACYMTGHILLLILLYKTSNVSRFQYLIFFLVTAVASAILLVDRNNLNNWPIFIIYAATLAAVFAFSLKNRYYRFGCVVFLLGDLIGLGHMTLPMMNNPFAHVLSLGIYYTGMMGFATSTYEKANQSVTFMDKNS